MTLILGFYSNTGIVLTADSRCIEEWRTGERQVSDNNQKIFPLSDLPVAIAIYGERRINNQDISDIVKRFALDNTDFIKITTLKEVAVKLRQYIDFDVKARLKELEWQKTVVGFWVSGFSPGNNYPEIWEASWKHPNDAVIKPLGNLSRAGEAAKLINWQIDKHSKAEYGTNKINPANIRYLVGCHNKIYVLAEKMQEGSGKDIFGGHKHQLAITKQGWEWIVSLP